MAAGSSDHGLWPLGIRLEVLPGSNLREKFQRAAEYGFDAVELPGRYLSEYRDELMAEHDRLPLPVASLSLGFRGSLVSADACSRSQCRHDLKQLLLGAAGLIMPPVLHQDAQARLKDPVSGGNLVDAHDALMIEQLPELATFARNQGIVLFLEPVNHTETDYLQRLDHAVSLCSKVNDRGLAITADFYHMRIEETDAWAALRAAAPWVRHVHVADRQRAEPQAGNDDDLVSGFRALREMEYDGFVVTECRHLSGSADRVLPRSAQFLRRCMTAVK